MDVYFLRSSITRACYVTKLLISISQVLESRVALEEGLLAEKLDELDQTLAAEDLGNRAVRDHTCGMM